MADEANDVDVEKVSIADLVLDPDNVRTRKDVADLVDSLRELGQHRLIVVQRGTNRVIAGNHTVKAALALGWTQINVLWTDDDDKTAIRRGLADNFTGDQGGYDRVQLRSVLAELDDDVKIPGLGDGQLAKLLRDVGADADDRPVYPLTPNMGEAHGYVIILADNQVDLAWLADTFGVRREQSYKSPEVAESRVITVERARQLLDRG